MKRAITLGAIGLFVAFFLMYGCNKRNKFVDLNEGVKSQWKQVESQYQRRLDLIPNIVATVKGQANFEKETLEGIVAARAKATQITIDPSKLDENSMAKYKQAQGEISSALGRLLMVTENYPELKANQAFSDLRVELEGCENRISVERMKYNDAVKEFNASIKKIPGSLFAWGYKDAAYFEAEAGAEKAPKVEF
ncbi:MAG: LemA family protein [Bacteroidia bacterium]|nr:LemA family protein [Bacteroidia bacterium]